MTSSIPAAILIGLVVTWEISDGEAVPCSTAVPSGAGVQSVLLRDGISADYAELVALATKPRSMFPELRTFNSVIPGSPNNCSAGGSQEQSEGTACSTSSDVCSVASQSDGHCSAQGDTDVAFCSASDTPDPGAGQCSIMAGPGSSMHCSSRGHEFTWCSAQGATPQTPAAICSVFEGSDDHTQPNGCSTYGLLNKNRSKCSVFGWGLCSVLAGLVDAECTTLVSEPERGGIPGGTCSTMNVFGGPAEGPFYCSTISLDPPGVTPPDPVTGRCKGIL